MSDHPVPTVWVLTDGKAGDEQPLIGVAAALGAEPELRRVSPRPAFAFLMPGGPIDWKDRPSTPGSPLAPPFPDICLATCRWVRGSLKQTVSVSGEAFFNARR